MRYERYIVASNERVIPSIVFFMSQCKSTVLGWCVGITRYARRPTEFGLVRPENGTGVIQRFINDSGGDEKRVTLFGESAGVYLVCRRMLGGPREKPLFYRAVVMSGVSGSLMILVQRKEVDKAFDKICEILGIEE